MSDLLISSDTSREMHRAIESWWGPVMFSTLLVCGRVWLPSRRLARPSELQSKRACFGCLPAGPGQGWPGRGRPRASGSLVREQWFAERAAQAPDDCRSDRSGSRPGPRPARPGCVSRPVALAGGDSRQASGRRSKQCLPGRVQGPPRSHGQFGRRPLEAGDVVQATWSQTRGHRPSDGRHAARPRTRSRLETTRLQETWVALDHRAATGRTERRGRARRKADKYWTTRAGPDCGAGWKTSRGGPRRPGNSRALPSPSAVPSVWAIFARGNTSHQKLAVQLLGQIDSPDSTRALAILAIASESGEVRGRSIETLRRRDPREIASFLVGRLRDLELDRDPILYHYLVATDRLERDRLVGLPVHPRPVLRYFQDLHRR